MSLRCVQCNCVIEDVDGVLSPSDECECESGLCADCCECGDDHLAASVARLADAPTSGAKASPLEPDAPQT